MELEDRGNTLKFGSPGEIGVGLMYIYMFMFMFMFMFMYTANCKL